MLLLHLCFPFVHIKKFSMSLSCPIIWDTLFSIKHLHCNTIQSIKCWNAAYLYEWLILSQEMTGKNSSITHQELKPKNQTPHKNLGAQCEPFLSSVPYRVFNLPLFYQDLHTHVGGSWEETSKAVNDWTSLWHVTGMMIWVIAVEDSST